MGDSDTVREADELLESGQLEEARKLYEEAHAIPETAVAALVGLGRIALYSDDAEGARLRLEEALQRDPKNAAAMAFRGMLYEREGDRPKALDWYRQAVEIDENDPTTRLYLGRALLEEGKYTLAEVQLQAAVHLRPRDPLGYYLLGSVFLANGRRADATLRFARAIEVDPDFAEAYEALGDLLFELGRREEASRILRSGIARLDEASALACLRVLVPEASDPEEFSTALDFLSSGLPSNPEQQALCVRLSQRAIELGNLHDAERIVRRLVELCPGLAAGHQQRGAVLEALGRGKEAMEAYTRAHELDATLWEAASGLGRLRLEQGGEAEAEDGLRLLKLGTELGGTDPRPYFHLAQGYLKVGRPDRARRAALKVARSADAPEHMVEQARDLLRRLPVR